MSVNQAEDSVQKQNAAEVRVLDSALKLFSDKGYEGTSIREIIERAGVTRPVLYYYFENKEQLFCRLVESSFAQFIEEMDGVTEHFSGCRDRLYALIGAGFDRAERTPEVVRLIMHAFFSPPEDGPRLDKARLVTRRYKRLTQIMADGLESGELSGDDPRALALAFGGIMDIHIMARSQQSEPQLTKKLGAELVDLFMGGAANGRG